MPTITLYSTDHNWGSSSYNSSTDIKVGKTGSTSSDGTKYRGRVKFDAPPQNVQITSIKLYMRRIDSYSTHTQQIGSSSSGAWGASLDWSRNISVSSGTGTKNWDITEYKSQIGAYSTAWFIHISHGSGTNSYTEFEGDGSNRPYVVIEYQMPASVPTVSSSNVTLGSSAFTIYTNREYSEYVHTIKYTFGGSSGMIGTSVAASIDWTPPLSLASQIPSATSGSCTITCETYFGGALTGTKTCSLTQTVPSTVVPTISNVTVTEAVSGQAAKFGAFVQNKSKAAIYTSAAGSYGSTISSYKATLNGTTYTGQSFTTGTLDWSGNQTLTVTVTDSRGRTASTTRTVSVTAYAAPAITRFTADRCNAGGTAAQSDGTRVWISVTATAASVGAKNDMTCQIQHKLKSSGTWTNTTTLAHSSYSVSQTNYALPTTFTFAVLNSYDIRVTVSDYFGSVTADATINTKQVVFDIKADGTGVAFGKVSETANLLDVAWPIRLRSSATFDDGAAVRNALGLGNTTGAVPVANGGTGGTTAAVARANLAAPCLVSANGYWGLGFADGTSENWMRTTTNGLIPHASGGAGSLGTSSWPFSNIHALNTYGGNWQGTAIPVAKGGTGATVGNAALQNLGLKCVTFYTVSTQSHTAGTYYMERWNVERNGDSAYYTTYANGGFISGVLLNYEGFYQISVTLHWEKSSSEAKGMAMLVISNNVSGLAASQTSLPSQGALANVGNFYQYNGPGSATNTTASLSICVYIPAGYYVIPYGYLAGNAKTQKEGRFSVVRLGGA